MINKKIPTGDDYTVREWVPMCRAGDCIHRSECVLVSTNVFDPIHKLKCPAKAQQAIRRAEGWSYPEMTVSVEKGTVKVVCHSYSGDIGEAVIHMKDWRKKK